MRVLNQFLLGATALASFCAAQSSNLGFTGVPTTVTAGQPVTVNFTEVQDAGAVTITLRKGNPANLTTIQTLTSSASNGTFLWIPGNSYEEADDYALEIQQGNDVNYSGAFAITGSDPSAVSSAMAATASLASVGAALTQSFASSMSVASIESLISAYNASLASLTAAPTTSSAIGSSAGTGSAIPRNTTFSAATLTATTTTSQITQGASSTGAAPTATTSKAAAVRTISVISGASPLALVLCIVAGILV